MLNRDEGELTEALGTRVEGLFISKPATDDGGVVEKGIDSKRPSDSC